MNADEFNEEEFNQLKLNLAGPVFRQNSVRNDVNFEGDTSCLARIDKKLASLEITFKSLEDEVDKLSTVITDIKNTAGSIIKKLENNNKLILELTEIVKSKLFF
jgi:archaellum component FlaC